jgi:hypothetical protein
MNKLCALIILTQYHSLTPDWGGVGNPPPTPAYSWERPGWSSGSLKMNAVPSYGSGGFIGTYGSGTAGGTFNPPVSRDDDFGVE